jgi:yecA family protein
MAARPIVWDTFRHAPAARPSPPDIRSLGVLEFTFEDRATLNDWLAEGGWPRWHMDAATLEGYLVALLVWPVDVAPGVWMPPIWGISGWKIPAKISSQTSYSKFEGLIVGFLHYLDRQITTPDPGFVPTLPLKNADCSPRGVVGVCWAQGFLKALQQGLQGPQWRSDAALSAIDRIAHYALAPTTNSRTDQAIAAELAAAVSLLAAERTSRGPLGALAIPNRTPRGVRAAVAVNPGSSTAAGVPQISLPPASGFQGER